jgi:hypothetical protein
MEWQSSHNLVFYFANENKKLMKKGKKEEKDNDVPPKKGKKKLHNEVRCLSKQDFHFYLCDTPTFLLFHAGRYLMRGKRRPRGW